jgi:hypothetical protein
MSGDECCALAAGDQTDAVETIACGAFHCLETGARGGTLDEQRLARFDLQRGEEERPHHVCRGSGRQIPRPRA